ncbi:hypothetical protein BJ508DRAFT_9712 [Ascobolus immersus RN42]|uniref:Uncharacterized protein n=1 Tax=Ascobolus immersus RN42 TaxID=1160509 RepID=A0A3N4HRK6_ASCIM|nr:hypothetical protein BJ508DRAFT_9712 [Ascobolus immersus RN42]
MDPMEVDDGEPRRKRAAGETNETTGFSQGNKRHRQATRPDKKASVAPDIPRTLPPPELVLIPQISFGSTTSTATPQTSQPDIVKNDLHYSSKSISLSSLVHRTISTIAPPEVAALIAGFMGTDTKRAHIPTRSTSSSASSMPTEMADPLRFTHSPTSQAPLPVTTSSSYTLSKADKLSSQQQAPSLSHPEVLPEFHADSSASIYDSRQGSTTMVTTPQLTSVNEPKEPKYRLPTTIQMAKDLNPAPALPDSVDECYTADELEELRLDFQAIDAYNLRMEDLELEARKKMNMRLAQSIFKGRIAQSIITLDAAIGFIGDHLRTCGVLESCRFQSSPRHRRGRGVWEVVVDIGCLERVSKALKGTSLEWMNPLLREVERPTVVPDTSHCEGSKG